jgi:hypothetical protein
MQFHLADSEQGNACPCCGWAPAPRAKSIAVEEAELAELSDDPDQLTPNDARVIGFYRESCGWYSRRWPERWQANPNKGRGWAWMQTREKFRISEYVRIPSAYWTLPELQPTPEVTGWLKHRLIKWARSKARAA